jgi:hypothetical protein
MIQRILTRFSRDDGGAVLALVALGSIALVGIAALAIDLGMLYTARSEAQRAADAAALAGASAFQNGDPVAEPWWVDTARTRAYDLAALNRIRNAAVTADEVVVEPNPAAYTVTVTVTRERIGLWFAPVLGIPVGTVSARATAEAAQAGAVNPTKCIKPFALPDMWEERSPTQDLDGNQIWDFERERACNGQCSKENWRFDQGVDVYRPRTMQNPTGYGTEFRTGKMDHSGRHYEKDDGRRIPIKIEDVPSYWQVWALEGRGFPSAEAAIMGCVNRTMAIGDQVEAEPGNMANPIYQTFMKLINEGERDWTDENGNTISGRPGDPTARWDEATGTVVNSSLADWRESSRVITVALFDPNGMGPGRHNLDFVDFALFFLEKPEDVFPNYNPIHQAPITGRLLRFTPGAPGGTSPGSLTRRLRLIK